MTACPLCHGDPAALVAKRWELLIPRKVESQNRFTCRGHRGIYEREKKAWADDLYLAAHVAGVWRVAKAAPSRRRMIMTRILGRGERAYDHANLVGGLKPVVDAAKLAGLIIDDSPTWLEAYYHQDDSQRANGPALELVIEVLVGSQKEREG